jgi:copper homeostasis protein
MEGAGMLKRMIELSNGKVTVLPAGKITADNLTALAGIIGAYEYHGKKIVGDPG